MAKIHNGPIEQYLRETGKTAEQFSADLKSGDAAAASIFAAETLYGAIHDLIMAVETRSETEG